MRVVIPQIAWHHRDPVLTLDFDPKGKYEEGYYRIATGGADRLLLIWHLSNPTHLKPDIFCVSELNRHQKGINVVRFSPCGNYIASGDDDSYVFIWKNESVAEREEVWNVEKIFRRHVEDVSDLCWSQDSNYLVSGSVDNTAVLWDVKKGTPIHFWSEREHTGFVQGVVLDPLGEISATMCIDRNLRFFNNKTGKIVSKTLKYPSAWLGYNDEEETKENAPETVPSSQENVTEPEKLDDVNINEEIKDETSIPIKEDAVKPSAVEICNDISPLAPSEDENVPPQSITEQSAEVSEEPRDKPLSEINGEEQLPFKLPPKRPVVTLNRLFHDDSLKTFCRRLSFSPRGELLIVPGGLLPPVEKGKEAEESEEKVESRQSTPVDGEDEEAKEKEKPAKKYDSDQNNAVIIFCRNSWSNPCAVIPTGESYSIAAKFNPLYFERERQTFEYDPDLVNSNKRNERSISCVGKLRPATKDEGILLNMPYRLVYAVANNDSLIIGDTSSVEPLACIRNIHCTRMTDISWSPDGLVLIASSTDGFCSILTFEKGELGAEFKAEGEEFPALTPNCFPIAPPDPKPVKKKEPKEPKEPKEKKEKEPKEKKEKEPKEKKEKKEKVKDPATPSENKEEKKKKALTLPEMVNSGKIPPPTFVNSPSTPMVEKLKQAQEAGPSSPSVSSAPGTPNSETTTPKPKNSFMANWLKQTPNSSKSDSKTPRRIQLTTLSSSTKTAPNVVGTNTNTASEVASPKQVSVKQPRRIELIDLDNDGEPNAKRRAVEDAVKDKPVPEKDSSVSPAMENKPLDDITRPSGDVVNGGHASKETEAKVNVNDVVQKAPRRIAPTLLSSRALKTDNSESPKINPVEKVISKLSNGTVHSDKNVSEKVASDALLTNGKEVSSSTKGEKAGEQSTIINDKTGDKDEMEIQSSADLPNGTDEKCKSRNTVPPV